MNLITGSGTARPKEIQFTIFIDEEPEIFIPKVMQVIKTRNQENFEHISEELMTHSLLISLK